MAIPEAVSLVLQAGAVADSYGTYILEMGRPVMIVDLAKKMLEVMGAKNVQVEYTGLRPGEKLHEELIEEGERRVPTDHPMVYRLLPNDRQFLGAIQRAEQILSYAHRQDADRALELLYESIPSYSPAAITPSGE
jgi:FlaA1/EpsC-like NDP-sugar epimerase